MRSSRETPPIGSKVISRVGTPKRRATSACPSSCNTMVKKIATVSRSPATTA